MEQQFENTRELLVLTKAVVRKQRAKRELLVSCFLSLSLRNREVKHLKASVSPKTYLQGSLSAASPYNFQPNPNLG